MQLTVDIKENVERVRDRIARAARRVQRDPDEVALVAASKLVAPERLATAIAAGITTFGENRVQEASEKITRLGPLGQRVHWHLIGTLQTNKVRYIFDLFDMVQSVDSLRLAREIDRRGERAGKVMDVLIQVNIAGEPTKHGLETAETLRMVEEIAQLSHIRIRGLMTIPPLSPDPEGSRPYFRRLVALRDEVEKLGLPGVEMRQLSMGMTGDFEVAVEEGATMVRIGTAIFGERPH